MVEFNNKAGQVRVQLAAKEYRRLLHSSDGSLILLGDGFLSIIRPHALESVNRKVKPIRTFIEQASRVGKPFEDN